MLEKFSILIGKWKGKGTACFPTIETTDFIEESEFLLTGDGESIIFNQQTWHFDNFAKDNKGNVLHFESGFIIAYPDGSLELLNAQNSKRVEVMKSTEVIFGENKLQLSFASKYFGNDERMVRTTRDFFISENSLSYIMKMETKNTPEFQLHLESNLIRI